MCFGKKSDDPESKRNEDIEKQIRVDRKRQEREVKLLLLGEHLLVSGVLRLQQTDRDFKVPERAARAQC